MIRFAFVIAGLLTVAISARAQSQTARVGDVTRLQGQGVNVLTGYGLVSGLAGTGDGSKFLPTMQALAATMQRFGANIASIDDVEASKNTAIVMLEVVVPEHGAREGDLIDVRVTAVAAKNLTGGQLLPTPLVYHDPTVPGLFAFAQGRIVPSGSSLTTGVIKGGARMERDVLMNVISRGTDLQSAGFNSPWLRSEASYITLVLDEAHGGWAMAAAVAQAVDRELAISVNADRVALALDSRSIVVLVPEHQRSDPAAWIRDVERAPILLESNEARVSINRIAKTIVVTGDTRISPVIVSQAGLTVTVENAIADPTIPQPPEMQFFVPMDSERDRTPNVRNLLDVLNRLKVPFEDRVSIMEEIHRVGKLHARLMYEG